MSNDYGILMHRSMSRSNFMCKSCEGLKFLLVNDLKPTLKDDVQMVNTRNNINTYLLGK
jgi:hypothetical protein